MARIGRAWLRPGRRLLLPAVVLAASVSVGAEVLSKGPASFVVSHEMVLAAPPERAFEALTSEVQRWWDAEHSYSGEAANFSLEPTAGGCFCERIPGGGSVEHMRVVLVWPGRLLRLTGGLGPLQSMGASGPMDFAFQPEGENRSRLSFRYTVSGHVPDGLAGMAEPVNAVLGGQLARLAAYLESGDPDGGEPAQ